MQKVFNGRFTGPRFVEKFTNGVWTVFDRLQFKATAAFLTKKAAETEAKKCNR